MNYNNLKQSKSRRPITHNRSGEKNDFHQMGLIRRDKVLVANKT